MAVISPPKVWVRTVPIAHPLKFAKAAINLPIGPNPSELPLNNIGRIAGMRENSDNWVFRIQRSGCGVGVVDEVADDDGLSNSSKYTPARPDVIHAAVTAKNPLSGDMVCIAVATISGISDRVEC